LSCSSTSNSLASKNSLLFLSPLPWRGRIKVKGFTVFPSPLAEEGQGEGLLPAYIILEHSDTLYVYLDRIAVP
jgi:hypothetical protein